MNALVDAMFGRQFMIFFKEAGWRESSGFESDYNLHYGIFCNSWRN